MCERVCVRVCVRDALALLCAREVAMCECVRTYAPMSVRGRVHMCVRVLERARACVCLIEPAPRAPLLRAFSEGFPRRLEMALQLDRGGRGGGDLNRDDTFYENKERN